MKYRPLFTAILQTMAMFVAAFVIPVLGQVIALLTPVPLIVVSIRIGMGAGLISLAASTALVGLLAGWQAAAILFFTFGLMAFGVSEGMRRRWRPESAALLGGFLPIVVLTILIAYYLSHLDKNLITVIEEYLHASMGEAEKFYSQMGLTEMSNAIKSVSDSFIHYLVRLLPGITIATSIFQAACCYGLSLAILSKSQPGETQQTSLAQWHAPDVWVWGMIAGLSLVLVPQEVARFTGWNITIVYTVVYLAQGVAVVDYFLRKAHIQPFMRGLLHTLILALPSIVFVIALGIVDIWADMRKVRGPIRSEAP